MRGFTEHHRFPSTSFAKPLSRYFDIIPCFRIFLLLIPALLVYRKQEETWVIIATKCRNVNWYPNASSHMPSKLHILKAVRYDRKCFHDSLNRTRVISGNEKLTEATVRKPVSSHSVDFPFRVLLFRLLPFRLLYQQTKAKEHCNYIGLVISSGNETILPFNNSPNQILSDHAKSLEKLNPHLFWSADVYHHHVQHNLKRWSFGNKASTFWKQKTFDWVCSWEILNMRHRERHYISDERLSSISMLNHIVLKDQKI